VSGCGSVPDTSVPATSGLVGKSAELIMDISQADSTAQREEAIQEVISRGSSLGLIDEDGRQANPNALENAISLTPDDITALAYFAEIGHYRTLGSIIDYLAEAGVTLSSTGRVVTFNDLLPDLQKYVNWSFHNADEADSQLGILLASGPYLETPTSPPAFEPTTQISPMAAILMLGDILVGVEDGTAEGVASNWFTKVAYAADLQETAKRIQGLITEVEKLLKPAGATVNFFKKAGETLGWVEPSTAPPIELKIPDVAKKLIGAFAAGNHFAVRVKTPGSMSADLSVAKSIELDAISDSIALFLSVELIGSGKNQGSITGDIPVLYTLRLLSPNESGSGVPLYPDADAILSPASAITTTGANGHIMDIAGKGMELPAIAYIEASKLDNKERRIAVLYASATILTSDLAAEYEKYTKQYASAISAVGLKPEEVREMFSIMKTAVTVSPWMVNVILTGGPEVTIDPADLKGETNKLYKFTAKIDNVPAGSRWEWSVVRDRGSGYVDKVEFNTGPDNIATASFPADGNYLVRVILWDSFNEAIDDATVKVVIEGKKGNGIEIWIDPEKAIGETGCQVRFTIVPNVPWDELPDKVIWQWDFDDNTGIVETEASPGRGVPRNEGYHNYTWPGTKHVSVKMLDGETRNVIAMAEATADINDLNAIQRTTHVRALFWAFQSRPTYFDLNGVLTLRNESMTHTSVGISSSGAPPLEWTDNRFYVTWGSIVDTQTYKYTIDGTVSQDASEVEMITLTTEFRDTNYEGKLWTRKEVLVLRSIPIDKSSCGDSVRFYKYWVGETPLGYPLADLVHYEYESRIVGDYGDKGDRLDKFETFSYTDQKPVIEIEFSVPK
jgi:hypothetical protein